jgi:hypothetical protein
MTNKMSQPGSGIDGKPRTVDRWNEAGRERAMLEILATVLAGQANGLDADEIVGEVETGTRGALVVAGSDFLPKDWAA